MQNRVAYFQSLARYLTPGGRVAIVDFRPHGFFAGLLGHGTAKEEIRREMEAAGYRLVADYDFIDRQSFQVFSRKNSAATVSWPLSGRPWPDLGGRELPTISLN
jgi:hypothetical protein